MVLKLKDKQRIVTEMSAVAARASSVIAAGYRGLTVSEMTEMRSKAREAGVYLKVVRNTLAARSVQGTDFACISELLVGPLILAFSFEMPGAAARFMRDYAKLHEKFSVKVIALGGKLLAPKDLEALANLPNREEALALLMSVMKAPISKFVRTSTEIYTQFVRTVAAVRDQKQAAE